MLASMIVTANKNLATMANKIATNISSDIYLTKINYSDKLTTMEKTNLDAIHKTMFYLEQLAPSSNPPRICVRYCRHQFNSQFHVKRIERNTLNYIN